MTDLTGTGEQSVTGNLSVDGVELVNADKITFSWGTTSSAVDWSELTNAWATNSTIAGSLIMTAMVVPTQVSVDQSAFTWDKELERRELERAHSTRKRLRRHPKKPRARRLIELNLEES